jgi:hypothetical protein
MNRLSSRASGVFSVLVRRPLPGRAIRRRKIGCREISRCAICACIFLNCALFISCGGGGSNSTSTPPPPTATLTQITLGPANQSVAKGTSLQLSATGTYSNGSQQNLTSSVTWKASPSTIATVSAQGNLQALGQGVAQITATYQGITGNLSVTVGAATLVSIALNPSDGSLPLGESESITATGNFSDGSTQNLTSSVTWQANPQTVATISIQGSLTALGQGTAQVSAAYQGVTGTASITIGPPALLSIAVTPTQSTLPLGDSEPLTATGTFSNATIQTLTSVSWSSSSPAIATINSTGSASSVSVGYVTISATVGSVTGTAALRVSSAVLTSLSIAPSNPSLVLGNTGQLQATGTFSDGSTQNMTSIVAWASQQPDIVGVTSAGVATAVQVGTVTISVARSGITASTSITVTPLMTISYFNTANAIAAGSDGTLRLVNPGFVPGNTCAMIYVFDDKQELNECCGCNISDSGLLTLSLLNDLTASPLNGEQPAAGTIQIVPATPQGGICNAASTNPNSLILGWETNVQGASSYYQLTEAPLTIVPINSSQAQNLANLCSAMQQLGSGSGTCTCGTGD